MVTSDPALLASINQPCFTTARNWLKAYVHHTDSIPLNYWDELSSIKNAAVAVDDQLSAKAAWCLETIAKIQESFIRSFGYLTSDDFKESWELLDRCQNEIHFLDKHFEERANEFGIEHVRKHAKQIQDLFPYERGWSPAIVRKIIRCSTCGSRLTLRNKCNHITGEIYNGEMCCNLIEQAKILHVSLVDKPRHKYAVVFPEGNDDPRLSHLREIASRLDTPWRCWDYTEEASRTYPRKDSHVGRNDPCPCGSDRKYKHCCLGEETLSYHLIISIGEVVGPVKPESL